MIFHVSYDFGIWRRHPTTKTAMIDDAWAAITEGHGHPAMGDFDASEVLEQLTSRFSSVEDDPDHALIAEEGRDDDAAWIIVHAPHSAAQEYTGVLMEVALAHNLMLWDPQRGAVWGNRRPPKNPRSSLPA